MAVFRRVSIVFPPEKKTKLSNGKRDFYTILGERETSRKKFFCLAQGEKFFCAGRLRAQSKSIVIKTAHFELQTASWYFVMRFSLRSNPMSRSEGKQMSRAHIDRSELLSVKNFFSWEKKNVEKVRWKKCREGLGFYAPFSVRFFSLDKEKSCWVIFRNTYIHRYAVHTY